MRLRQGTIAAYAGDHTVDVTLGGGATVLAGVRFFSNYAPMVGDACWVMIHRRDAFIIGTTTSVAPMCRLDRAADQSMAVGTDYIAWDDPLTLDPWGCWSSGQTGRLTIQLPGVYDGMQSVVWDNVGGGTQRQSAIEVNGTTLRGFENQPPTTAYQTMTESYMHPRNLDAGEYLRVRTNQDSAGTRAIKGSTSAPFLSVRWLGPQTV
jgi:hypothetical protein